MKLETRCESGVVAVAVAVVVSAIGQLEEN